VGNRTRDRERAIAAHIAHCLAVADGLDPEALSEDLKISGGAVEPAELARVLPTLARQFGVELDVADREVLAVLSYVDDLAGLVLRRMLAGGRPVRSLPTVLTHV
jgi:hypothetical protein